MDLTAYKDLYDFSLIEKAIQSFFISTGYFVQPPDEDDPTREAWTAGSDEVAFFTAFEERIFQKSTPRVVVALHNIVQQSKIGHAIVDNNGAIRNNLWTGSIRFGMVTQPNYKYHTQMRAMVISLAEMIAPMVSDKTKLIGANQFLSSLQIAYCQTQSFDTSVTAAEGFYFSTLNYQLTFGIYEQAILAVAG